MSAIVNVRIGAMAAALSGFLLSAAIAADTDPSPYSDFAAAPIHDLARAKPGVSRRCPMMGSA